MARLTKDQWEQARALWEGDPEVTFQDIANIFGCSRPAVGQKAEKDGWKRGGSKPAAQAAPGTAPAPAPDSDPTPAPPAPEEKKAPPASKAPAASPPPGRKAGKGRAKQSDDPPVLPPESRLSSADWQLLTGKRPVGRPTAYRPEFAEEIIAYFDIPVQSVVDYEDVDDQGNTVVRKRVVTNTFPMLSRFASKIGVTRDTLYEWATARDKEGALKHPEFSYAYARAKDLQEALLAEGGMMGLYEPRFATLTAKNVAGWKDQVETKAEVTVQPINTAALDDVYARGMEQMRAAKDAIMARAGELAELLGKKG